VWGALPSVSPAKLGSARGHPSPERHQTAASPVSRSVPGFKRDDDVRCFRLVKLETSRVVVAPAGKIHDLGRHVSFIAHSFRLGRPKAMNHAISRSAEPPTSGGHVKLGQGRRLPFSPRGSRMAASAVRTAAAGWASKTSGDRSVRASGSRLAREARGWRRARCARRRRDRRRKTSGDRAARRRRPRGARNAAPLGNFHQLLDLDALFRLLGAFRRRYCFI
jgi:hypothetical protein